MRDDVYTIDPDSESDSDSHLAPNKRFWNRKSFAAVSTGTIGILTLLILFGAGTFQSSEQRYRSQDIRSSAKSSPPIPTLSMILDSFKGVVVCSPSDGGCEPQIVTESKTFTVSADSSTRQKLKNLPTGTHVEVQGQIIQNPTQKSGGNSSASVFVKTLIIPASYPSPTSGSYPLITLTPTATLTPTVTPTITPTPTISDPPNIKEIVDESPGNDGDILTVVGYIVNANIGEEACLYLDQCDYSTFIVNNDSGLGRDLTYDVLVKASKDELESDYYVNQKVSFTAQVIMVNGDMTLEKQY